MPAPSPRAIVREAAARYGVPFWLLWGTAGAESTWGRGGSNLFGLLAAAEGANISDWSSAANQAAKTYAGLINQYGSVAAAVPHYSGNSYTVEHVEQLAKEGGVAVVPEASQPTRAAAPGSGTSASSSSGSGGDDLLDFLLTGVAVLGGVGLIIFGTSRAFGSSAAAEAVHG